jgi:hypothetical protein
VGVAVADIGAVAMGNLVTQNTLRDNDIDLANRSESEGNVLVRNNCKISEPERLCR